MRRRTRRGSTFGLWGSVLAMTLGATVGPVAASTSELAGCDSVGANDAAGAAARYVLTGDVVCATEQRPTLTLRNGGLLDLGDYTLAGVDVRCHGSCRIVGPGTIDGGTITSAGRLLLRRVTVVNSPADGVVVREPRGRGRVTIIDSTIADSAGNGIEFDRRATIVRSAVRGNGLHGVAVSMRDGNDCARGRLTAKASSFVDNGRDGDCGPAEVCADVATCTAREAKLGSSSSCEHSRQLGSGMPGASCGVCDFD
jgi:hypothetical protein